MENTGLGCGIVGLTRRDKKPFLSSLKSHFTDMFFFFFINDAYAAECNPDLSFLGAKDSSILPSCPKLQVE